MTLSHQQAKKRANEYLRSEGSSAEALKATRNQSYGVWVIDYDDPAATDGPLFGSGGLAVLDNGEVHRLGSVPGALDDLMTHLGIPSAADQPDAWEREGEALALLADDDYEEAAGLAAYADAKRRGEI